MKIFLDSTFKNDFFESVFKSFIYAIFGLILGITVNKLSRKTNKIFKMSVFMNIFIQLLYCSIVFAIIKKYVSEKFVDNWINKMEGLFFVGVFFGVQYGMFADIQNYTNSSVGSE